MRKIRSYHGVEADPQLASLAHHLSRIDFPIDNEHRDRYKAILNSGVNDNFRNTVTRGKAFGVRLYLGGKKRIVGICGNHIIACRFADMALRRFWVYRVRSAAPPVDADLNFGIASAEWDEANIPEAIALLDLIEDHLVSIKAFPCAIKTEEKRKEVREQRLKRRTMRGDMSEFRDGLTFELDKLSAQLLRMEETFKRTGERLEAIEKIQGQIVEALSPTP
jgi:hypothetical protein